MLIKIPCHWSTQIRYIPSLKGTPTTSLLITHMQRTIFTGFYPDYNKLHVIDTSDNQTFQRWRKCPPQRRERHDTHHQNYYSQSMGMLWRRNLCRRLRIDVGKVFLPIDRRSVFHILGRVLRLRIRHCLTSVERMDHGDWCVVLHSMSMWLLWVCVLDTKIAMTQVSSVDFVADLSRFEDWWRGTGFWIGEGPVTGL